MNTLTHHKGLEQLPPRQTRRQHQPLLILRIFLLLELPDKRRDQLLDQLLEQLLDQLQQLRQLGITIISPAAAAKSFMAPTNSFLA